MKDLTFLYPPFLNHAYTLPSFLSSIFKYLINKNYLKITNNLSLNEYLKQMPSQNILLTPLEAVSLYKAAYFASKKADIVEIGSWRGGSAVILAAALKDSKSKNKLHCIDPYSSERDMISKKYLKEHTLNLGLKNLKQNYYYFLSLLRQFDLKKQVNVHISRSEVFFDFWKGNVGFIFIDGNHSFKVVNNDIRMWSKKVIKYGLVGVHDCDNRTTGKPGLPGPTKAVKIFFEKNKDWRCVGQSDSLIFFQRVS